MQWSSRRPWRRYAAEIGTAMLISLPLLSSPAVAGPEAEPQVDFGGGGLGLLLCGSKPSIGTISVPAQSKVTFVNNLGQNALLQIDGESGGPVGRGEAVEVQFHRGPVAVAMVPECLLNLTGDFKPVTVEVSQQRRATTTSTRTSSPRPSTTGSASTPTNATSSNTANSPKPAKSRSTRAAAPSGGADPTEPTIDDELFPVDLGESESESPGPNSHATATVITNLDGSPDLRASSSGTRDKGPIGLLAIIATVCVVGVSAGAIRAIISQRASRAEFA